MNTVYSTTTSRQFDLRVETGERTFRREILLDDFACSTEEEVLGDAGELVGTGDAQFAFFGRRVRFSRLEDYRLEYWRYTVSLD
jgi:hypothetical protein